jgi:hypothetical protein
MALWKKSLVILASTVLVGGVVVAANAVTTSTSSATYSACVNSTTKTLSDVTVNSSPKCPSHSRLITWNARGSVGTSGTRGSLWSAGSAAPSAVVGQLDGDLYLDTATGDVYEFVSGAWTSEGSVRGPAGPAGPTGSTGAAGQNGSAGTPGNSAAVGENCPSGQSVTGLDSSGNIECSYPVSLVMQENTYNCGATCWGSYSGAGLEVGATVNVYASAPFSGLVSSGVVASDGTAGGDLGLTCNHGWAGVYATSTTAAGVTITSNIVNSPCG